MVSKSSIKNDTVEALKTEMRCLIESIYGTTKILHIYIRMGTFLVRSV